MAELKFWDLSNVSDEHLLRDLRGFVARGGRVDASVVAHLAEVEERRLHLKAAASSLFDYCLRRLGFSESEAFHRITAARLARRFPVIFELLGARSIHLSALRILRDHLTPENHHELLAASSGRSKKEVEVLVAALAPRPDVPTRLRKLPIRRGTPGLPRTACDGEARPSLAAPCAERTQSSLDCALPQLADLGLVGTASAGSASAGSVSAGSVSAGSASAGSVSAGSVSAGSVSAGSASAGSVSVAKVGGGSSSSLSDVVRGQRGKRLGNEAQERGVARLRAFEPLSSTRYLLRMCVGCEFKDKLEHARDLMSHGNPSNELVVILERALDLLVEKLEKQRFARTKCSRTPRRKLMDLGSIALPRQRDASDLEASVREDSTLSDLCEHRGGESSKPPAVVLNERGGGESSEAPAVMFSEQWDSESSKRSAVMFSERGEDESCGPMAVMFSERCGGEPHKVLGSKSCGRSGAEFGELAGVVSCERRLAVLDMPSDDAMFHERLDAFRRRRAVELTSGEGGPRPSCDAESGLVQNRRGVGGRRRYVPNEIRRAVAMRDGDRCTYVDEEGRRCPSRAFLQLHHEQAYALGGASTFENLRLLCGPHNRLLAERDFGRVHQARCIASKASGGPAAGFERM